LSSPLTYISPRLQVEVPWSWLRSLGYSPFSFFQYGRAYATVLRLSSVLYVLWLNGAS